MDRFGNNSAELIDEMLENGKPLKRNMAGEKAENEIQNILVTGFGPFGFHIVNASWEVVKELNNYKLPGYNIITMEVPVTYQYVDENIQDLWDEHVPELVIHCGVSHLAQALTIEQRAYRTEYHRKDADDKFHPTGDAFPEGPFKIETLIDVEDLCGNIQGIDVVKSDDAGRFLCEYIYYKSLAIDPSKALFIHVPMLRDPFTTENLSQALFQIIERILNQDSSTINEIDSSKL